MIETDQIALYQQILQGVKENKIQLPSRPDLFMNLQKLSEDPDISVRKLRLVIGQDPALAVRIMSIANSPIMRGSVSITSLDSAINRLGIRFVTYISMGLALKQLFIARHKQIEERMNFIWDYCGKVAASSYVLAKSLKLFPPEEVMLAGLVHEIGKLPILTFADTVNEQLAQSPYLDPVLAQLHPKLGNDILKLWKFPSDIACVPMNVADHTLKSDKPLISDIIQVARQHVMQHETPDGKEEFTEQQNPAYLRLEIDQLLDQVAMKHMKNELNTHQQLFT